MLFSNFKNSKIRILTEFSSHPNPRYIYMSGFISSSPFQNTKRFLQIQSLAPGIARRSSGRFQLRRQLRRAITPNPCIVCCRRFKTGGSLDRRVNCRRVPQPRWVGARRSAKGGKQPEGDMRKRGNPRPSCLSRAQVGCACSRGLQASTREGASGLTRAPSRPSPRGQPP
jgi:hypothetical protein